MVGKLRPLKNILKTMNTTNNPLPSTLNKEILLAIDPSLTGTGAAIIEQNKVKAAYLIATKKPKEGKDNRLVEIAVRIKELLQKYNPTVLAIESQYIAIRSSSVIKVIEVKGIIEGLFIGNCIDKKIEPVIIEVHPIEAKQAIGVTGRLKRKESKEAVKKMVSLMYPELKDEKQDILDAVAIGLAGHVKNKFNNLTK